MLGIYTTTRRVLWRLPSCVSRIDSNRHNIVYLHTVTGTIYTYVGLWRHRDRLPRIKDLIRASQTTMLDTPTRQACASLLASML
jgi:hypothetical protein